MNNSNFLKEIRDSAPADKHIKTPEELNKIYGTISRLRQRDFLWGMITALIIVSLTYIYIRDYM